MKSKKCLKIFILFFLLFEFLCPTVLLAQIYNDFNSNLQVYNVIWWNNNYTSMTSAISKESSSGFIGVTKRPASIEALSYLALTKDESGFYQPVLASNWRQITNNQYLDIKDSIVELRKKLYVLISQNNDKKIILNTLRKSISSKIPIDSIIEIREKTNKIEQETSKLEEEAKVIEQSLKELDRIKFDKSEINTQEVVLLQANQKLRSIKNGR
jgi:hypothetical protein